MEKETTKKKEEYKILETTINDNGGLDIEALNLSTNKKVIFKNCTIKDISQPYGLIEGPIAEIYYSGGKYDKTVKLIYDNAIKPFVEKHNYKLEECEIKYEMITPNKVLVKIRPIKEVVDFTLDITIE